MVIEFDNLEYTTDKNKAVPQLEHDFRPLQSEPNLVFKCEYFRAGEIMSYMDFKGDGRISYKFNDIFADKVKKISGISVKDKKTGKETPIEDAKTFLKYPGKGVFDQIITIVTAHLISGDGLTENELGN